mmetsp:Transcript_5670/g.8009  ORF Transcript_5670/g.8009 Transcript_5670/m.8009 type:complete len:226 (-) Transcript_5670:276-953(-)
MTWEGPANWEVPVSTATRQSWQMDCLLPSMVMSSMRTSQYPLVPETLTQNKSDAICSGFVAPKVTSDFSSSESDRKTEKIGCFKRLSLSSLPMALKSSPCAICGRARPSTPSKLKLSKGLDDSSKEEIKWPIEQAPPMQIMSWMHSPVTLPVPNVMVISSASPSLDSVPSQFTRVPCCDSSISNRLCVWQASDWHLLPGMMRLPLPVSNTTTKSWGGLPTVMVPK